MRRVVRIAAYVPAGRSNEVPVAALDEDEFTLGATATERAWAAPREEPGAVVVHLVGDVPPAADWGYAALLGREVEVAHHGSGSGELVRALRELEEGPGGPALIVAAELPERTPERGAAKSTASGAAAVAYLLKSSEEPGPFPLPKGSARGSAVRTTLRLGEPSKEAARAVTLVGDWGGEPGNRRTIERKVPKRTVDGELSVTSEGAYVPRARYLENLPSRWRFIAEACSACRGTTFPARGVCRRCGRADALSPVHLPYDGGRVVAVTTVGKGGQPTEFDAQVEALGPYDVALVELARGMRVTLQVTDSVPGELEVGDRVNTMLRRLYPMEGEWRYGRKAVPAHPSRAPRKRN